MKKRLFALVLVVALAASMLCGCGGGGEEIAGTGVGLFEGEPVELTIMLSTDANGGGVSDVFNKYVEMTGIKANIITAPTASFSEKLNATLASGTLPDIVFMSAQVANIWQEEGALLPLDDLIEAYAPNIQKVLTEDDKKQLMNPDDRQLYGVPYILRLPAMNSMGVRRDWLQKLGLEAPTTIEELETVLTAFKDNAQMLNNGAPVIPMAGLLSAFYGMFGINPSGDQGQWTLDADGNYISIYEHPNYRAFLETLNRFYEKGLIDPEYLSRNGDQNAIYTLFNGGTAGMGFVYSTRLREITSILQESNKDAFFDFMPPITGIDGKKQIPGRQELGNQGCITIAAKGKEKACIQFLDWAYGEEGNRLLNYGIEGKTYDMVDGKPVIKDEYNQGWVEIRKVGVVATNLAYNRDLDAYNQCMLYGKNVEDLNEFEKLTYRAYYENEPYVVKPLRAFSTPASQKRGTEVYAALKEKEAKAVAGKISVDEFFEELKTIKANGLDEMTKEMQEYWAKVQ